MISPASPDSSHLGAFLDIIDKTVKIAALLIGGGWAYLNYRRGRTFKRRLEPSISGKIVAQNGRLFLSGVAQVKNLGLSKVVIEQRGTAVEVAGLSMPDTSASDATSELMKVLSVFEAHGWIEPGEPVQEAFFISIPPKVGLVALRLRLRIVSEHIEWNADSIVEINMNNPEGPVTTELQNNSIAERGSQEISIG